MVPSALFLTRTLSGSAATSTQFPLLHLLDRRQFGSSGVRGDVASPNPLVVLWRWRYELALLIGIPLAVYAFGPLTLTAGVIPVAAVLWPPARSEVWGRIRCVVTAHRIRVGFVEAYIANRRGKIPPILWCAPAPFGERVWVWCRAGITPADLERGRAVIATACWAADVVVRPRAGSPHWVLLDVIRARHAMDRWAAADSAPTEAARFTSS